ncbi:MAG: TRAP transporter small permease [Pseudomonadota bacterium]
MAPDRATATRDATDQEPVPPRDPQLASADVVKRDTTFDRLLDAVAFACKVITGVGLVFLTVIFGWLVYGRYVLNATPTWVEQVSLLLVMLITFVGAGVGVHERTHLSVNVFRIALPWPLRRLIIGACHLALGAFGLVMMWHSYKLAVFKWGSMIPLINVPEGLRAIPITVCGALIVLFSIGNLIALWRGFDEDFSIDD